MINCKFLKINRHLLFGVNYMPDVYLIPIQITCAPSDENFLNRSDVFLSRGAVQKPKFPTYTLDITPEKLAGVLRYFEGYSRSLTRGKIEPISTADSIERYLSDFITHRRLVAENPIPHHRQVQKIISNLQTYYERRNGVERPSLTELLQFSNI